MNKLTAQILWLLMLFMGSFHGYAQLTLYDVIELARGQSSSAKAAETRVKNQYWTYRTFRAGYNPELNLTGNLPGYNRDYFQVSQDDGSFTYLSREQVSSNLNLGLVQPVAFTGGEVSVNSSVNYFNDLQASSSDLNPIYSTTVFNVQLVQPIFGFNELKWDKRTEPLVYEESKRSYVEEMEAISAEVTGLFFNYLDAQINLQIAEFNLGNNDTIFYIARGRYNIGTVSKDELLQVELQLLRSRQDVAQARLDMQTSRLALRSYLGLVDSTSDSLQLVAPQQIPDFYVDAYKALEYAKLNRADYVAFERRRVEADRDVAEARAQRFETELTASFGLNKAAGQWGNTYQSPNDQQRLNVTLSMPILDWGRSKSRVQTALANQELTQYTLTQEIQNFEQEIVSIVKQMEVLRLQVEITRKSDEVAQERYVVAQNRYLIGKIDITNLNIALTEKDEARRSYINALRSFWTTYFDLRRLTLYDFLNDKLLYQEKD